MQKLSILIITKNESKNIKDCIKSAWFADEIVVVDSNSDDSTVSIAKKLGAKVFIMPWMGYGRQKNYGIKLCEGDWIFSMDADERISKPLGLEILDVINNSRFDIYNVHRKTYFISKFINYSGWQTDKVTRLFKKGKAKFTNHYVHEHLSHRGDASSLKEVLLHYSFLNFEVVLKKINIYSSLASKNLKKQKKTSSLKKALFHGCWAFNKTYFLRLGFLDGREGFMLAFSHFEYTYYKYLKRIYD